MSCRCSFVSRKYCDDRRRDHCPRQQQAGGDPDNRGAVVLGVVAADLARLRRLAKLAALTAGAAAARPRLGVGVAIEVAQVAQLALHVGAEDAANLGAAVLVALDLIEQIEMDAAVVHVTGPLIVPSAMCAVVLMDWYCALRMACALSGSMPQSRLRASACRAQVRSAARSRSTSA